MFKRITAFFLSLMLICLAAAPALATSVSDELRDMLAAGTFRPADVGFPAQESYDFPYMGLTMQLPDGLLKQLEARETYMTMAEGERSEAGELTYAQVTWSAMTEEQRNAELSMMDDGFSTWLASLRLMGMVGFYHTDVLDQLDQLSGCTRHEKLGESADGKYHYYLSLADGLSDDEGALIQGVALTYTDIEPYPDFCGADILAEQEADSPVSAEEAAGLRFTTEDISGNPVDESVFAQHRLTLVNVMATWCSPCVAEMPELAQLSQAMTEQGVGVAAFVLDARSMRGGLDSTAIDTAKRLAERTGVTFPLLVPDETMLGGLLNVTAVPTTYFVDENGALVGEPVLGSKNLAQWQAIVEQRLAMLPETK